MEVILTQNVEKLGRIGEVVKVKDGYARNFLFPQCLAMVATKSNIKALDKRKQKADELYQQQKNAAEKLAEELSKVSCTVTVEVNEEEKLYGSVTEADISKALEAEGQSVDKKDILIEQPIEQLGIFDVSAKLHPEVKATFRLWVTKK